MTKTAAQLRKTPLYDQHLALGARMIAFGGWLMPVQYRGIIAEYDHTRRCASLFDTCHMSEFIVRGDSGGSGLDRVVTCRLNDMPLKTCRYGMMLNEQGGVVDDCIVFRRDHEEWLIVANGGTIEKDEAHLRRNLANPSALENATGRLGKIDLQGPLARSVLERLMPGIGKLGYYTFDDFEYRGEKILVSRTGYTGELGYELFCSSQCVDRLWNDCLRLDPVEPAGLGARDALRLEMGYPLYGNDMDETTTPFETGLSKFVDLEKDVLGRDALVRQKQNGVPYRSVCFISRTRQSPRHGQNLLDEEKRVVGVVTSGGFSPHSRRGMGLGRIRKDYTAQKKTFYFGTPERTVAAEIVKRPVYSKGSLRY